MRNPYLPVKSKLDAQIYGFRTSPHFHMSFVRAFKSTKKIMSDAMSESYKAEREYEIKYSKWKEQLGKSEKCESIPKYF